MTKTLKNSRDKQKGASKRQKKVVAAEIGEAVLREAPDARPKPQAAKPAAAPEVAPAPRPVRSAPKPAPEVALAPPPVRSAPRPAPEVAPTPPLRSAPRPAPVKPVPAASGPAKHALESAVETFERSFKAAGEGAYAVNRKLIDIAQENVNSGLELARDLAGARNPLEIVRLHMSYWHDCLGAFESQAKELHKLQAEAVARAAEPVRAHMRRA